MKLHIHIISLVSELLNYCNSIGKNIYIHVLVKKVCIYITTVNELTGRTLNTKLACSHLTSIQPTNY